MSRSRKSKQRGKVGRPRRSRIGRYILIAALVGVVGLCVLGFAAYLWVRSYLHSEQFREFVGAETSKTLNAEGQFEEFEWEGKSMYTRSFSAQGTPEAMFSRMKAHEIRAKVSLGGVSRGVWEIPSVQIDRFDFMVSDDRLVGDDSAGDALVVEESSGGGGGFFSGLIPSEVEVQEVKVKNVNFNVMSEGLEVEARGIRVGMVPTSAKDGYSVAGDAGTLVVNQLPRFTIDDFNLRTGLDQVFVDHAALRFYESAKVQLSGDVGIDEKPSRVRLNGVLGGLDLADVLAPDWVQKFKGIVGGKFKLETIPGSAGDLAVSGTLGLSNGSLEAMPVLQRVDALAGTTRFRKLTFTNVEVEFEQRRGTLSLNEVLFESAGLTCLKGRMTRSPSGVPEGIYMLGVSPDTIKWIPIGRKEVVEQVFQMDRDSAFAEVFPTAAVVDVAKPPEGYRWMVVRIDPLSPDPYTADIRRQFIDAGGLAIWAELQGMSERVVKAAGEVAKVAGDQGVDLIGELSKEGFGSGSMLLTEDIMDKLGETLAIEDLFEEGTAIPKSIIDSGLDVIDELNPLSPKRK